MVTKFHINKNGVPARCEAKNGNCPLKQTTHYNTKEEAQIAADKMNEQQYGILPENKNNITKERNSHRKRESLNDKRPRERKVKDRSERKPKKEKEYVKARTKEELEHIEKRLYEMSQEGSESYYNRCRSVEKNHTFVPSSYVVNHYKEDRASRSRKIRDNFGNGDLIGFYKVNHEIGTKNKEYRDQMIEIRDNGSLTVYDMRTGNKVTTFIALSKRVELMMLKAGEIPSENLLKRIDENKKKAVKEKIND